MFIGNNNPLGIGIQEQEIDPGGNNRDTNKITTSSDVEMRSEVEDAIGDVAMYGSNSTCGRDERKSGTMWSYKDAVNQKEDDWNEYFQNWGLNDIEEDLVQQGQEEGMPAGDATVPNDEIPVIEIDNQTRRRIIQPWKNCLIGKVVGKTVGYKYISSKTRELWNPSGKIDILDLGNDFFLFKLELPEDFKHALLEGPWFVNGHHLAMMRWSVNFRPSVSSINRTVVWVRLPELPLEYYDEKVLSDVASKLGKLIKIDKTTELVLRGRFAHFCIEIDTNVALKSMVQIGSIRQRIEYEGISLICFHCGKINHKKDNCPSLHSVNNSNVASQPAAVDAGKVENGESFGPWMLVAARKHKPVMVGGRVGNAWNSENAKGQSSASTSVEGAEGQWQVVNKQRGRGSSGFISSSDKVRSQSKQDLQSLPNQFFGGQKPNQVKNTKGSGKDNGYSRKLRGDYFTTTDDRPAILIQTTVLNF
ncbi:hypothetical protein MKW98_012300 [Papaver atlanticum]|uniref:CCHC-type domain-containing protein n=1 Tax=Papaver atlanticum TaxID=357466 RepID=A0AAD4XPN6_9MAGN|nr:hypothetical protein MKW98_012300 [Papaver atlanticum]